MPLEPWTRGIYNAAAAFGSGDAVEEAARQHEEARLLAQARAQVSLDNQLLRSKLLSQKYDSRVAAAELMTPDQAPFVLGELGSDYAAMAKARLSEQELSGRAAAFDRFSAGDWGGGNAGMAAYAAPGPSPVAAVQGGVVVGNRYLPGGGTIATTPVGESQVAVNNAAAATHQARAKDVMDRGQATIDATRALEAQRKAATKGSSAATAFLGATEEVAQAQQNIASFIDTLTGRGGQKTPTGRPQSEVQATEATKQAELRAASRSPTGEAFDVSEPTIEPDAPLTPDLGVGAVADLMTPARGAAPAGKPPVKGAKRAPNGKWYVQRNGKFYPVVED